jgi:hypothetical protein
MSRKLRKMINLIKISHLLKSFLTSFLMISVFILLGVYFNGLSKIQHDLGLWITFLIFFINLILINRYESIYEEGISSFYKFIENINLYKQKFEQYKKIFLVIIIYMYLFF